MPTRPSIPTRASLLERLRSGDSIEGWQDFYQTYGGLLRRFALKAGLSSEEAEEVVQETAIGVARKLPGFRYDPTVCSFKTWMLRLAHWRIVDALRRRRSLGPGSGTIVPGPTGDDTGGTARIDRIPDPRVPDFGAQWDAAWEGNLRQAALDGVRQSIDPGQFQIFDLYVLKQCPAREVAQRLGVGTARVYLAKQRVGARLRREMRRLERESNRGLRHV